MGEATEAGARATGCVHVHRTGPIDCGELPGAAGEDGQGFRVPVLGHVIVGGGVPAEEKTLRRCFDVTDLEERRKALL